MASKSESFKASIGSTEVFRLTFELLSHSISRNSLDFKYDNLHSTEQRLQIVLTERLIQDIFQSLIKLSQRKISVEEKLSLLTKLQEESLSQILSAKTRYVETCSQHKQLNKYRITKQQNGSISRLQELVSEVLSEYNKSIIRAKRREQFLESSNRRLVVLYTWSLTWKKYLLRTKFELFRNISSKISMKYQITHLTPNQDSNEIEYIIKKINRKIGLFSDISFIPVSVVRFSKNLIRTLEIEPSSLKNQSKLSSIIRYGSTVEELGLMMNDISNWYSTSKNTSQQDSSINQRPGSAGRKSPRNPYNNIKKKKFTLKKSQFLSNSSIEWLNHPFYAKQIWNHLTGHEKFALDICQNNLSIIEDTLFERFVKNFQLQSHFTFSDDRIYICLEERSLSQLKNLIPLIDNLEALDLNISSNAEDFFAQGLYTSLQEIYTDYPHTEYTLTSKSLANVKSEEKLNLLKQILMSHPLRIKAYKDTHRKNISHLPISKKASYKTLSSHLQIFPDIIQVESMVDGSIFHFAPAFVYNLLEATKDIPKSNTLTLFTSIIPKSFDASTSQDQQTLSTTDHLLKLLIALDSDSINHLKKNYSEESDNNFDPYLNQEENISAHHFQKWSNLLILPDDCRDRKISYHSNNNNRSLRYHYLLISEDTQFGLDKQEDSNGNPFSQSCCYFVQLYPENDFLHLEQNFLHNQPFSTLSSNITNQLLNEYDYFLMKCMVQSYLQYFKGPYFIQSSTEKNSLNQQSSTIPINSDLPIPSSKKQQWDVTILSKLCHWRSCSCESFNNIQSNYLCNYHFELKGFLDVKLPQILLNKASTSSESSKYLPKKPPSFPSTLDLSSLYELRKRDLMTIRAASTLLQELWDGRLKSTMKIFSKKIIQDMKLKNFWSNQLILLSKYYPHLFHNNKTKSSDFNGNRFSVSASPTWIIWKNQAHLEKTLKGQSMSLELLQTIKSLEDAVSLEIQAMGKLLYFPTQELLLIKRDMKVFKELQDQVLASSNITMTQSIGGVIDSQSPIKTNQQADDFSIDKNKNLMPSSSSNNIQVFSNHYDNLIHILEEENKLCEKKFQLLHQRREIEEENRSLHQRKLAKARAIEEEQSRDPTSFKNQGNRF